MSRWTWRSVLAVGALTALAGVASAQDLNSALFPPKLPTPIPPISVTSHPGESPNSIESPPPPTIPELPLSIRPTRSPSPLFVEPGMAKPASGAIVPAALVTQPSGIHLSRPVTYPEELPYEETVFGLAARAPSFIDQAAPLHVFRVRYDAFWNMRRPDRAEYFYPKPRYLREAIGVEGSYGLPEREIQIDAQELSIYVEVLLAPHVSLFTDVPFRFINPEINVDEAGLSDVSLGLKWAFINEPTRAVSFQVRGTAPTGLGERGMGSELIIVEPGLLWQEAIGDRVTLFGGVHDRIPIGQRSTFAGNILRYGLGASVMAFELAHVRVMPTYEAVGWTVLGGRESADLESTDPLVQDSRGTTVINGFYGVRFTFGDDFASRGYLAMSDLYVGYGQAYTNDSWYRDIIRVEYRLRF